MTQNGDTPLHYAVNRKDWHVIEQLVRAGANPRAANNEGVRPLDRADPITRLRVRQVLNDMSWLARALPLPLSLAHSIIRHKYRS